MTDSSGTIAAILKAGGAAADLPFWEGCSRGHFLLHRCGICGRHYWPASRCVAHGGADMAWVEASGQGTLHTYTILHHAYTPSMQGKTPYVVGVVKLEEGPFFHSNIIDCDIGRIAVGMRLEHVMVADDSGLILPKFRPQT